MASFLRTIRNELIEFPRNPKGYPNLQVKKVESRARTDLKTLIYRSKISGETNNYIAYIQFYRIQFSETKSKEFNVPGKDEGTGGLIYYKKPSTDKNPVSLNCSCPDFQHRWAYSLHDHNALVGDPIPYKRVTKTRPEVNPKHLMGFCKHIHSMVMTLKDSGTITE